MAEGLNEVRLLGNLGQDPDFKMTQGGMGVLKLSVATAARVKDKNEQWVDKVEWHRVTVFGKRAEGLQKCLQKGSQIMVLGSLRTSSYEDKEGVKRYTTEVIADKVLLCGGRASGGARQSEAPKSNADDYPVDDLDSSNLPF